MGCGCEDLQAVTLQVGEEFDVTLDGETIVVRLTWVGDREATIAVREGP